MEITFIQREEAEAFAPFLNAGIAPQSPVLIGARDEEGPAGVCVLNQVSPGSLSIQWIYTAPEKRKKGVAAAMIRWLADWAKEYRFLIRCIYEDNPIVGHILLTNGFEIRRHVMNEYAVSWKEFESMIAPLAKQMSGSGTDPAVSLRALRSSQVRELYQRCMDPDSVLFRQLDLQMLGEADMDLSAAVLVKDEIDALLLLKKCGDADYEIIWIWNASGKDRALAWLFRKMLEAVAENRIHPETIRFAAVSERVDAFAQKHFTEAALIRTEMMEAIYV